MDYLFDTTKSAQESLEKAIELAQKAIAVDEGLADGHAILGMFYSLKGEHDKALAEGERAVTLNPNGADSYRWYGSILTSAGRPEEAIPMIQKAIRLNPFASTYYFVNLGDALRNTGRFEEAVSAYKKALQPAPNNIFAHVNLAATYSTMGREKDAQVEAAEVLRLYPKFSLENWTRKMPFFRDQLQNDKAINTMRKAGLK